MAKHPNSEYMPAPWQVHRFGNQVACWLGDGSTRYMTASDARKIAAALTKAARSCEREPQFSTSTLGTLSGTTSGKQL